MNKVNSESISPGAIEYARLCFVATEHEEDGSGSAAPACGTRTTVKSAPGKPGETLTIDGVMSGDQRVFEVYGIQRDSTNDPCPADSHYAFGARPSRVFLLGTSGPITIKPPKVEPNPKINITIAIPDSGQTLLVTAKLPTTCNASANPVADAPRSGRMQVGAAALSSPHLKLAGRVSDHAQDSNLKSAHYKMLGWVHGQ